MKNKSQAAFRLLHAATRCVVVLLHARAMRRGKEILTMKRTLSLVLLAAFALSTGACACRPGVVGPYGARPPRCWVW
jgi:hypothetical protein